MIVSTCRRLWCLSAYQKYTSSFTSFLRYYILKNTAIWLANSILAHNSRTRIFVRYRIRGEISITILVFILISKISFHFQEKLIIFFKKLKKKTILERFWGPFCSNLGKMDFPGKKDCQFLNIPFIYHLSTIYLPSSQKSEKTNEPLMRKMLNWLMVRQTDRLTDRQTHTDKWWFNRTLQRTGVLRAFWRQN